MINSNRKIEVKKKETIEREAEDARRTELAMLKLLAKKYPSEAKKFLATVESSFSLTKSFV
jgi:hypothetical protein